MTRERRWEKKLMKASQEGDLETLALFQGVLDRTFSSMAGRPSELVEHALREEASKACMDLSDVQLQDFSRQISDRAQVKVAPPGPDVHEKPV